MSRQRQESVPLSEQSNSASGQHMPVIFQAARFSARHKLAIAAVSAVVVVPCFWHDHIEAGDLGSHLYNAWLAQLIERGEAPGLWIAKQHFNILFDLLLSGLARFFSFGATEKIAVSICVLIFFWGAFAFASSVSQRPAWTLIPILAVIAYGWTFHVGFFNYYLSVGLSFWALAIFWNGNFWERLIAIGLAFPVSLAHPLGFCWLIGAFTYVALAQRTPNRLQWLLVAASGGALFGVHRYLLGHALTYPAEHPFYFYNGVDQFVVFGRRYVPLAAVLCIFLISILVVELKAAQRSSEIWRAGRIPFQLYIAFELAILFIPDYIHSAAFQQPASVISPRLTLVSAVLVCSLLALVHPRKWHWIGGGCLAALFFAFVFQDTSKLARLEKRVEKLVQTVPVGSRVISQGLKLPGTRMLGEHFLDRACIGRCFNYANYEPASGQFRVRAQAGNPFVSSMLHFKDDADLHAGNYEIDAPPSPTYKVYKRPSSEDFCLVPFSAKPSAPQ